MFLGQRCHVLRDAFDFTHLLLKPAGPDAPETGATIAWYGAVAFWLLLELFDLLQILKVLLAIADLVTSSWQSL